MTTITPKLKAVGYIRVSTKEQAVDGYSLGAQKEKIQQYCVLNNLELINIYADEGISGKNIEGREGIKTLLEDASSNKHPFDVVVIWKLSRLSRRQLDTLSIIEQLNDHNISLQSISEKLDQSSSSGKFMLQIMASLNELERNTIRENVGLGHRAKAADGEWNGGKVLGYDSIKGEDGKNKLVINDGEAKIVRKIYEQYLNGHGYRYIANKLNHEGFTTKRGNKFGTIAVKDILLNPLYKGEIKYGRKAKNIQDLKNKPIITQGIHDPIVDKDTWDAVYHLWQKTSKQPAHTKLGTHILTGIIKCPQCGSHMVVSNSSYKLKDGTRVRKSYYTCGQFKNKGALACKANGIEVERAENIVAERFESLVDSDKLKLHLLSKIQEQTVDDKEQLLAHKKLLTNKIINSEKHIKDYKDKMLEEPKLADVWEQAVNRIETEKEELISELLITKERISKESQSIDLKLVTELVGKLIDLMKSSSSKRDLKPLYQTFLKQITWNKETHQFDIQLYFDETNIAEYLSNDFDPDPDTALQSNQVHKTLNAEKSLPFGGLFLHAPIEIWI